MTPKTYKFAEFELDLADGTLRNSESVIRLQEKPLRLLSTLLDHPQRVVTREQLRDRMWDSRTVVNFEQGINVAMKKVRSALGDTAENPRFIETLAKKGYRFLVPVDAVSGTVAAAEVPALTAIDVMPQSLSETLSTRLLPSRLMVASIVSIMFCAVGWGFYASQSKPGHARQIKSIAVLPLRDVSPGGEQDYFAEGITDEVITNLAQTLPLRVISRGSVMRFKHTNESTPQIATELGVDALLEGSVARSGNRVSVTVQLIDAADDRHLWAHTYERGLEDILWIEAELSQAIAKRVGNTLGAQPGKLVNSQPVDPQIYELCLLGRYHWNKRTNAEFAKAEGYYRQAIERDPDYAPAYAGLADVYALSASYGSVPLQDTLAKALASARHALALDEGLAEAHAAVGLIGITSEQAGDQSEIEFRRALELDPNFAAAHHWFAFYLLFSGRRDEALSEMALARQLDPLSAVTNADEGALLYAARRFAEARVRLNQAIDLEPEFGQPRETLALMDLEAGNSVAALQEARRGLALDSLNPRTIGEAGYVFARTGDKEEATKLLGTLKELQRHGSASPTYVSLIQVGLGQIGDAHDTLRAKLLATGGTNDSVLWQWHAFDKIRMDSGY